MHLVPNPCLCACAGGASRRSRAWTCARCTPLSMAIRVRRSVRSTSGSLWRASRSPLQGRPPTTWAAGCSWSGGTTSSRGRPFSVGLVNRVCGGEGGRRVCAASLPPDPFHVDLHLSCRSLSRHPPPVMLSPATLSPRPVTSPPNSFMKQHLSLGLCRGQRIWAPKLDSGVTMRTRSCRPAHTPSACRLR